MLAHNIHAGRRTKDIQISQDVTFETMLLAPNTLQGLTDSGFYKPSPIQLHAIPLGKCGFDLLMEAKSGTGKTAVFTIVALEKLDLELGLQVIILAPTREIAAQISDVVKLIGVKYEGLVVEVVMGGLPFEEDIKKFHKNVHIVVGSPGRLRFLIQNKHVNVSYVRLFVLDEADKLMEKSFISDINYIFSLLPDQKQVILSSATFSESTKSFISKYVRNAQHICPENDAILLGIEQNITTVKFNPNIVRQTQYRFKELLKILTKKGFKQCLIFCNYQARVTELYQLLLKHKWPVEQLYGKQDQIDRLEALKTLQSYKCRILICTDLAARGIDASNVDLVINFEPPYDWQTYLHRIGRAGRYGLYGIAISILSEGKEEHKFIQMLQTLNVPLNVYIFGTNEKVNMNVDSKKNVVETSLISNGSKGRDCVDLKEIWKEFTTESEKPELEPFEDLVKSYERHTTLMNEVKYRHMEMSSKTLEDLSTLLIQMKCNETNLNSKPSSSRNDKDNSKIQIKCNGAVLESNLNSIPSTSRYKDDKDNSKIYQDDYHNTKESKPERTEINSMNDNTTKSNKFTISKHKMQSDALLEAGLPVAFVSKKNIRRNQFTQIRKVEKKSNGTAKHMNLENDDDDEEEEENYTNTYYGFRAESVKPVLCETMINAKSKIRNKHISQSDSYKYKRTDQTNSLTNLEFIRNDYANWYRQVKLRTNHIAYVLYMNEMSRIRCYFNYI